MAECMRSVVFFDMRGMIARLQQYFTYSSDAQVGTISTGPLEQVVLRPVKFVIPAQHGQKDWGQRNITLFQTFAFTNVYLVPFAVYIAQFNINTLRYPCTGRIDKHNNSPVFEVWDRCQYIAHFFPGKNQGKSFCGLWSGKVFTGPLLVVYLCKEKFQGIITHFNTARLMITIAKHGLKVAAKFLGACLLRVLAMKNRIVIDVPPIGFPGAGT